MVALAVSKAYGGRASDGFIVNWFPENIADRGFKIDDLLAFYQYHLAILPSSRTNLQMEGSAICETSKIANARIYVEMAFWRLKEFSIFRHELPVQSRDQLQSLNKDSSLLNAII